MTTKKFIVKDTLVCDVTFLYLVECEPDDEGDYNPVGVYRDTQSKCIGHEVGAHH